MGPRWHVSATPITQIAKRNSLATYTPHLCAYSGITYLHVRRRSIRAIAFCERHGLERLPGHSVPPVSSIQEVEGTLY